MSGIPLEPLARGLHGKVAIVTGAGCAGSGIGNGRAISIMLADEGCNVICLDRNLSWAEKTVDMANSKPGRGLAVAIQGDVTSAADCEKTVQLALERFGRLDILINNVGVAGAPGTAVDVDIEGWAKTLEVNITSMMLMAKYAIPIMKKNEGETKGAIVNMGSIAGMQGGTPHLSYPTSKGAVINLTRAMAANHAREGIRVNCVCPGVCLRDMTSFSVWKETANTTSKMLYTPMMYEEGMTEEARRIRKESGLLGTEGTGWDAAAAVVFLASSHARWITGVILPVDAGATAAVTITMPASES